MTCDPGKIVQTFIKCSFMIQQVNSLNKRSKAPEIFCITAVSIGKRIGSRMSYLLILYQNTFRSNEILAFLDCRDPDCRDFVFFNTLFNDIAVIRFFPEEESECRHAVFKRE